MYFADIEMTEFGIFCVQVLHYWITNTFLLLAVSECLHQAAVTVSSRWGFSHISWFSLAS